MDDRFLNELRAEPRPEFARALRRRLEAQERPEASRRRLAPALAAAAAVAVVVALFAFPSVRASAQAMLDLFRVRTFAAVELDESRVEQLRALGGEGPMLVFDRHEVRDAGPARPYPSIEAASAAAGIEVRRPTFLPGGMSPESVFVEGAGEARLSVNAARLRDVLTRLDLRDVEVPEGIDGRIIEVRKAPIVIQTFGSERHEAGLVQGPSPEVSVPAGLDVVRLAEVGLRVLGLDAGEARRVARSTDWRGTLLVPVPLNASTFRQVTVHGQPGLLVTRATRSSQGRKREGTLVLWTEGGRVYGLKSTLGPGDALQVAESVR